MAIAIYVRVSSLSQDLASQETELAQWAKGKEVVWYRDKVTGKTMSRPAFDRLLTAVRGGRIKTIVVWRLDRLGRTASGLVTLLEELSRLGVNLVSLRDGLDLSTAAGRLMANVLASVAAFETEIRSERVRAGIVAAKKAGKTWGGSVAGRRLKATDDKVSAVLQMSQAGEKISVIARIVELSRPTIYKILKRS